MAYDKERQAQYHREWTKNNRQKRRDANNRWRASMWEWYRNLKSTLKCERCGFSHPAAITFHHKDPSQKELAIADALVKGWGKKRILEEISKCEILCANCHAIEHFNL